MLRADLLNDLVFIFTRSELDHNACECLYESIFHHLLQTGIVAKVLSSICVLLTRSSTGMCKVLNVVPPAPEDIAKTQFSTRSEVLTPVPVRVCADCTTTSPPVLGYIVAIHGQDESSWVCCKLMIDLEPRSCISCKACTRK